MPMRICLDKVDIWISRLDKVDWFQIIASKNVVKREPKRGIGQGNGLHLEKRNIVKELYAWRISQEYLLIL